MDDALPWIVAYGGVLWRVAIPVFVIAGVLVVRIAPSVRARWRARSARRHDGRPLAVAADLREGPAIVTGTVEARAPLGPDAEAITGGPAIAVSILRRGEAGDATAIACGAEGFAIRVGDQVVEIEGEIEIASGSEETRPVRFSRAIPALHLALGELDPAVAAELAVADPEIVVCALAAGDRVICRGHLRRDRRPEEPSDYRNAAVRWVIAPPPEGDGARVQLVALAGSRLKGEMRVARALLGACAGLAAFVGFFAVVGEIAHAIGERGSATAMQLAAATPFRRAEAIDSLAAMLAAAPPHHDPATLRAIAALGRLGAPCDTTIPALLSHGQIQLADQLSCPWPPELSAKARAWFERGEVETASRLFERSARGSPDARAILAHLLAGRLDVGADAARAASRLADGRARISLACLADWMDLKRADVPSASAHLEAEAYRTPTGEGCGLLFADLLLDCKVRSGFFKSQPNESDQLIPGARALRALLAGECDPSLDPQNTWQRGVHAPWLLFGLEERHLLEFVPAMFLAPGLARNQLPRGAFDPQQIAEAAFAASAMGEHARALRWIGMSPSGVDAASTLRAARVDTGLRAAIEGRSGARSAAPFAEQLGASSPSGALYRWWNEGSGDGGRLAHLLDLDPSAGEYAYLFADRASRGGDQIKRWLAWGPRPRPTITWIGLVADIEDRRLLAEAIGDTAGAADLDAQLARHRALLLRRDIVVPVAILEALSLTWSPRPEGSSL